MRINQSNRLTVGQRAKFIEAVRIGSNLFERAYTQYSRAYYEYKMSGFGFGQRDADELVVAIRKRFRAAGFKATVESQPIHNRFTRMLPRSSITIRLFEI